MTRCGVEVELQANLEIPAELPLIAQSGAHGVGLLRSEFLFMNRDVLPGEAAQADIYAGVVEAMEGDPVTIRVLDWGGEKEIEALVDAGIVPDASDANPALGLRGIRMLLQHPKLLETQLAAILRAAAHGPVRVMLPMVTNVAEVREARAIYQRGGGEAARPLVRLPATLPPLGAMVEVPAAALCADALAASSRLLRHRQQRPDDVHAGRRPCRSPRRPSIYNPVHPAVLRLIRMTVRRRRAPASPSRSAARWPPIPASSPLLLGMGVRSLSMNATAVPRVKQAVRTATIRRCEALADAVMAECEPEAVLDVLAEHDSRL